MDKRKPLNSLYVAFTIKPGNDRSRREKHGLISLINMGEMYEIRTMVWDQILRVIFNSSFPTLYPLCNEPIGKFY